MVAVFCISLYSTIKLVIIVLLGECVQKMASYIRLYACNRGVVVRRELDGDKQLEE